jgi:hypothetical protein
MIGRFILAVLIAASPLAALADTTVRAHEGGVRDGKKWGESYTEYHSSRGLRIDVTADGESSPGMSFLFLREPDRLYLVQGESVNRLDRERLQSLEAEGGAPAGGSVPRIAALETHRSVQGFVCSDFELRREGQPTRYLCLAPAKSLHLSPAFVADMRDLQAMLSRFVAVIERSQGKPPNSFNVYALTEGYLVRAWESANGETTWESQILSVKDGALSPDLFRVPDAPQ